MAGRRVHHPYDPPSRLIPGTEADLGLVFDIVRFYVQHNAYWNEHGNPHEGYQTQNATPACFTLFLARYSRSW